MEAKDCWGVKASDVVDRLDSSVERAEKLFGRRYLAAKALLTGTPLPRKEAPVISPPVRRPPVTQRRTPTREPVAPPQPAQPSAQPRRSAPQSKSVALIQPAPARPSPPPSASVAASVPSEGLIARLDVFIKHPDTKVPPGPKAKSYRKEAERLLRAREYLAALRASVLSLEAKAEYSYGAESQGSILSAIYKDGIPERMDDPAIGLERAQGLLAVKEDEPIAHLRAADFLRRLNRAGEALEHIGRAKALDPDIGTGYLEARCLGQTGENEKALQVLKAINPANPQFKTSLRLRLILYRKLGLFEEGLAFLDSIEGQRGLFPNYIGWEYRAQYLRLRGNQNKKVKDLQEAYIFMRKALKEVDFRSLEKVISIYTREFEAIGTEILALGGEIPPEEKAPAPPPAPSRPVPPRPAAPAPSPAAPEKPAPAVSSAALTQLVRRQQVLDEAEKALGERLRAATTREGRLREGEAALAKRIDAVASRESAVKAAEVALAAARESAVAQLEKRKQELDDLSQFLDDLAVALEKRGEALDAREADLAAEARAGVEQLKARVRELEAALAAAQKGKVPAQPARSFEEVWGDLCSMSPEELESIDPLLRELFTTNVSRRAHFLNRGVIIRRRGELLEFVVGKMISRQRVSTVVLKDEAPHLHNNAYINPRVRPFVFDKIRQAAQAIIDLMGSEQEAE